MNSLSAWYHALNAREQRMVLSGSIAAAVILLFAVFLPLDGSVSRERARVSRKQDDLAFIQAAAPQLAAAGPAVGAPASQGSLIVIVSTSAREAGLGHSLSSTEPSGNGALRVRLDRAPFDRMVTWLYQLSQRHGIHVESANVDATGASGLVNAGLVLRTAG